MTDPFGKELIRGNLDLMVLSVLREGPQYGYLIQKNLREASANRVRLPAGTLYPLLHRPETEKLVRTKTEDTSSRPRKWYELTAAGKRRLQDRADQWRALAQCMEQLMGAAPRPETN